MEKIIQHNVTNLIFITVILHSTKGGPRFPIAHALRLIATTLQAHMPTVWPEMGGKGWVSPPFLLPNLIFFVT